MELIGFNSRLRIGVWLDDLGLGLRNGLKRVRAWHLEELGIDALGPEMHPKVLSESGRRDLAHLIRSSGASLVALRADLGGRRFAETRSLDENLAKLEYAFSLCRGLGAPKLVTALGYIPAPDDNEETRTRETLTEALKALIQMATNFGTRPLILGGCEPAQNLSAFLKTHDRSELCGVDLQPGAFVSRGDDPLKALSILGSRVCLASAADHFRGGGEAPFGKGDVAWGELLVGLSTLPGGDPIGILATSVRECDRITALGNAVEKLRKQRLNPLG